MTARNQIRFGNKTNSKLVELTLITLSNLNEKSAFGMIRTLNVSISDRMIYSN